MSFPTRILPPAAVESLSSESKMTSIESSPSRGAPDGSLRPVDLARPRGGASRSGGAARGRSRRRGADAEPTPSSTSVPESSEPARPDVLPRLSAGEPDAAQELLDRYSGLVWSLARRHTRDPAEAEDAVQEVFLALWKNASRFDRSKASEPTFITLVARRRLIDLHRWKERRPKTVNDDLELELLPDLRSNEAEIRAEAQLAARALGVLKPREREVVLMSVQRGMSHTEISELLDIPLGTVKTYIRRGLIRVREAIEGGPKPSGEMS